MQMIRSTDFTKTESDVAVISDGRVSAAKVPTGTGHVGIDRMLSARVRALCNTASATGSFDLHLLFGEAPRGGSAGPYEGELVKIGTLAFTAGTSQIASTDPAAPSLYPCTTVTWTPTTAFTNMAAARNESGSAVVNSTHLHLQCLGGATALIAKPVTFSGAGVTANLMVEASRP
jgi:hypothetical protein